MTGAPTQSCDVCLLIEGAYPYVAGGVSTWVHDLLRAQSDLTFHLIVLVPDRAERKLRYELPPNVVGMSHVVLQDREPGPPWRSSLGGLLRHLVGPLIRLQEKGGFAEVRTVLEMIAPHRRNLGAWNLLESEAAWQLVLAMYRAATPGRSFLNYYWSWRSLIGGMFATLLAPLPSARVYHAISTGYAGLMATRARIETGRPVMLTEHGIYTNERRIEIMMAEWLRDDAAAGLAIEREGRDLRDIWIDTFESYARACYASCDRIITLYEGNQELQRRDGAAEDRLLLVPNGVDVPRYSAIPRRPAARPTIALIGRVVPIKDVKTFIRACAQLRRAVPDLRALVMGPTDEDEDYYEECRTLVAHEKLGDTLEFLGRVRLDDYLGEIDAIALTSISEAQPLVILEAGAAGVPTVATDVGACRQMLLGQRDEDPPLGPGGAITPLANPAATAHELGRLLTDRAWHDRCAGAIAERCRLYYDKDRIDRIYHDLYVELADAPGVAPDVPVDPRARVA
ncbi:MAG: GT4 family glycosyltransferase PelF [Alphaproteobacteria bacterium]